MCKSLKINRRNVLRVIGDYEVTGTDLHRCAVGIIAFIGGHPCQIGKVSPCCGVTLLADDLGDLPLTGIGHSLVARELVPEVVLDPVGQTWFIASSHDFLSGLPSLLMVRDDFRHMEINSTLIVHFCQEVSGTVIR